MAALFWRVSGNAVEAVTCSRVAYKFAPYEAKDVALLDLANILHSSGYPKDSLKLLNAALEHAPAVMTLHFALANVYSSLRDTSKAMLFYQSALDLRRSFLPVRERLLAIQCDNMLASPHVYQGNSKLKTYNPTIILNELRKNLQTVASKKAKKVRSP